MDPLLLSRIQFAFLIAFHFVLPAFTIGLASYIAVLEGCHVWTRRKAYLRLSAFWIRIFAVSFGMGVVSGIVMPFQFAAVTQADRSDSAAMLVNASTLGGVAIGPAIAGNFVTSDYGVIIAGSFGALVLALALLLLALRWSRRSATAK